MIEFRRSLVLALAVGWLVPAGARAQTAEQVIIKGDPAKRWIENDDLGFYYQIPTEWRLRAEITGPGTLIMFLVNHRSEAARSMSTLVVTRNERPWKRLKLGCGATKRRFTAGKKIIPCARLTRDLQIPAGPHQLGFKLSKTKWGASVHMIFVSQSVLDAEPELVATTVGGTTEEEAEAAEWQPASDADLIEPAATAEDPGAPAFPPPPASGGLSNPAVLVLAGVAVLAAGAGTVFGMQSRSRFADAEKTEIQTEIDDLNGAGETRAIIANVLFGVAALSLGSAAVLFVMEPADSDPAGTGSDASATAGVALRFDL